MRRRPECESRSLYLEDSLAGRPPYRRLFLDAMVTEESAGLKRVFHSALKHAANPVIRRDKPWEGWGPYVYGTVLWDEGRLRLWYSCIGKGSGFSCYAESDDGITWTKPELGLIEYEGSTANNIVGRFGLPSVIQRRKPAAETPMQETGLPWAVYCYHKDSGASVAFSEDGLRWRWEEARGKLFETSDVINFFYDPYLQRYTATYKTHNRRHRAVGIAFSNDGLRWQKPVEGPVFGADDLDPDATQIYGMPVFPYQGTYIGLPWIYHSRYLKYGTYSAERMYEAQEGSPCTVDVQLAWSWDLISWNRTPRRKPFIHLGPPGSFDWGMIYTARAPVIVGSELYFYYGGCNNIHDVSDVVCEIGLARLRLDGFCSMYADDNEGWLITRRERFATPRVFINAITSPNGYIVAELLDRHNNVIEGFSREECIPFTGDSIWQAIEWKRKTFSPEVAEKDKKVRFHLRNAHLYSYLPADSRTDE